MQDFKKIKVWEKSHQLALEIYRLTSSFPNSEMYGIVQQMRRAVYSIPANIAEGSCRKSDKDFSRYLHISLGSANELEYFVLLSKDLNYIDESKYQIFNDQINEIKKMLSSFIKKLQKETIANS